MLMTYIQLTVFGVGREHDDVGGGALDGVPQGRGAIGRFVWDTVAVQVGLEDVGFSLVITTQSIISKQ
jgi:hypothetical protein